MFDKQMIEYVPLYVHGTIHTELSKRSLDGGG